MLKHWKSIPQPLAELLERCLNERPDERPKDFEVVSRCFARLAQAEADIPVVGAIEPVVGTAIREGEPVYNAPAAEPDYYEVAPNNGRRKVLWILLILFGTLSLFCCGGGGFGLYYGYSELTDWISGESGQPTDDGNAVASNDASNPASNAGGNSARGEPWAVARRPSISAGRRKRNW